MDRRDLLATTLGAALAVIAYEGVALFQGQPGATSSAEASCPEPVPTRPVLRLGCGDHRDDLEQRLDLCAFDSRILRARLGRYEGFEQAWPGELPYELTGAGFDGTLHRLLHDHDGVELLGADCDEYPCMAVLRSFDEEGWPTLDLHAGLGEMLGEEVGIWNTATSSELAGMKVQLMLVAPLLPDSVDADLGRRLDHRAEVLLTDWSEDLLAEGATSPSSWPPGR